MYTAYYGDQLLYDPRDQDRQLYDQECSIALNEAGTYTFTMPSTHPLAGQLTVMDRFNEVTLYSNDAMVFRGRVASEETDFYGCPTYTCEGERAYLNDVPADKFWTYNDKDDGSTPDGVQVSPDLENVFRYLVSAYNCRAERAFAEGVNQGADIYPGTVNIQSTSRGGVWETIKSECVDAYGGYVRVRYDGGTAYIDYLAGGDHVCGQAVSFGNNLLDYVRTRDGSDICTRIIPVGQTVEVSHQEQKTDGDGNPEYDDDGNPEYETVVDVASGQDVYITPVPDNPLSAGYAKVGDHVVWEEGERTYGVIEKYVAYSDLSEPADLVSAALADLQKCVLGDTIDLSALDLSMLDASADRLAPGDYVRVTSEPHGLDCYLVCTAAALHPDAPDTDTYTLGLSRDELTQVQADRIAQLNGTITLVERVTTTGVQQAAAAASSASATAMKAQTAAAGAVKTAGQAVTTATEAASSAASAAEDAKAAKEQAQAIYSQAEQAVSSAEQAAKRAEEAGQQAVTAARVEYATSASATEAPESGWSSERPEHVSGEFTWVRTVFTNGAGTSTTSAPALVTGDKGDAGEAGAQGASVASVTTFWQLAASQPATPTGTADPSGWGKTIPTAAEGYTGSLWVTYRSVISDGSTSTATWTEPAKDSSYEYAQRCWQLEDGTYATARTLKSATDAVSTTLSKSYTTTDGMRSAISSAVTQTASDLTSEFAAVVGGRNLLLGTSVALSAEGDGGTDQKPGTYYYACGGFAKLEPSTTYTLGYTLRASAATTGTVRMQQNASPWYWGGTVSTHTPTTTATRHSLTFTTPASSTSTATGVQLRMDGIPTTVTVTLSDVQLERGSTATAWTPSPQDSSTLIRQSGDGVEVARKVGGAYTGTRAVLGSDALTFKSADGSTELASFGADVKSAGVSLLGGAATMVASDKAVTVSDKEQTTLTGLDIKAPFVNVSGGDYLATMGTSATVGGYDVSANVTAGLISGSYGSGSHSLVAGAYKTKTGEQHSAVLTLGVTPKADITCVDGTTVNSLGATAYGVRGGGKALYVVSKAITTGVTAYRHMGWVLVAFNNYVPSATDVTSGTHFTAGTLPDGWKPPAMMKGQLYAGSADYSAMGYVRSESGASNDGQVCVYTNYLPANQQVSGYLIYPATR